MIETKAMIEEPLEINCGTINGALIKNIEGCSDLGCMAIVGSTAYCIKSDSANTKAVFYKVKNYSTYKTAGVEANYTAKMLTGLYHTNGMAYSASDKKFYVTGYDNDKKIYKVFRLDLDGSINMTFSMPSKVSAIAQYESGKFILLANQEGKKDVSGNTYYCFLIGSFHTISKKFVEESRVYVKKEGYNTLQDITYFQGQIIMPTTYKEAVGDNQYQYLKNKVVIYDLKNTSPETIKDKSGKAFKYYCADTVLNVNKSMAANYKKFEVESPQVVDGKIVFVGNIERTVEPKSADGFQFITGFRFME